jgi:hypothetical protein
MKRYAKTKSCDEPWQPKKMQDLPRHLRGPSNNRYGGQQRSNLRGFRGSSYGPAGACRTLTGADKEQAIAKLHAQGHCD